MAKGRALARPSERSERFEPVVRPDWPDTVAAATQKEKADAAKMEGERGKLIVTLIGIKPTPFDNANNYGDLLATRCSDEPPMFRTSLAAWHFQVNALRKLPLA